MIPAETPGPKWNMWEYFVEVFMSNWRRTPKWALSASPVSAAFAGIATSSRAATSAKIEQDFFMRIGF